jgi:hypothetical protein
MKHPLRAFVAAGAMAFSLLGYADTAGAQTNACLSATPYTVHITAYLAQLMTRTDSIGSRARTGFNLPLVSPSAITFVVSDSICTAAANALVDAAGEPNEVPGPVWVLKVGTTRYIVFDGKHLVGDRDQQVVLDENLNFLVTISG